MEDFFEGVEDLSSITDRFLEGRRTLGHDHEFLEVDRRVRMGPAVDDVHHRHREDLCVGPAEVFIKRQVQTGGSGFGDRETDAENSVGSQLGLVRRAVQTDHDAVEDVLSGRALADEGGGDHFVDSIHCFRNALAKKALFVAIAQLPGFVFASGSAAGHRGTAQSTAFEEHIDFDSGISAGIDNFATGDLLDAES